MVSRQCDSVNCQNFYEAEARYLNRGQGRFCSQRCANLQIAKDRSNGSKTPNLVCAYCSKKFYRSPSKMSRSRSGLYFCSREHKDLSQRIGGIPEIQPTHYGNGTKLYRALAFRNYPHECSRCGYNKHPEILEVNHIDCNRENNDLSNLEILCPNCHKEYHFTTRTGNWSRRN